MPAPRPRRRTAALALCVLAAPAAWSALPAGAGTAASDTSSCHRGAPPLIHDGFPEPRLRLSRGGRLDTRLRAAPGRVRIDGRLVRAWSYEGSFPGPALVVCAGDRLTVHFVNGLPENTNLHLHGLHVSPRGSQDNVFLDLPPGKRFTYSYAIPRDNPPGSYWYHPHRHMLVNNQIFMGLAGPLIVEGGLDRVPALRHIPQRLVFIQSAQIAGGALVPAAKSVDAKTKYYVNGKLNPTAHIRPGEVQRWRIFNASNNRIAVLRLLGGHFEMLAQDGNTLPRPVAVRDMLIGPGSRREVLVRGGRPGRTVLKALPFAQHPGGDKAANGPTPNQTVLTLVSGGKPRHDRLPRVLGRPTMDLARAHVDRRRRLVFTENKSDPANPHFMLNGQEFDPSDVAITMKLGSVEEWSLVNKDTEWHTFHIHQNDFQVMSFKLDHPVKFQRAGRVPYVDDEDNVSMPPSSTTVVRMQPIDFTGKFVLHCHVIFHEDHGMMLAVAVAKNPTAAQSRASVVAGHGISVSSSAYGSTRVPALGTRTIALLCRLLGVRAPR